MSLNKKQREAVLLWIAEGLEHDEINKRAAKFRPKFEVSRRALSHYRKSRSVALNEIKYADEKSALTTGLARKENRVAALQQLANSMLIDLLPEHADGKGLLWTQFAKTVANEKYDYLEFNRGEVEALRGVLDDIAAEVGERAKKHGLSLNFDLSKLTDEQLQRLAAGEDPLKVIANA